MKNMILIKPSLAFTLLAISSLSKAQMPFDPYASIVINSSGLQPGIYGNASAALGKPTTWIKDSINGGTDQKLRAGLTYGAWNIAPNGTPLIVTIPAGGQITLAFKRPIFDDPKNFFGKDFIVFGNSFLASNLSYTASVNPFSINILGGPDFLEPMQVSVSPDLLNWHSFPLSSTTAADSLWPTQAFRWDSALGGFGEESDFSRPVHPDLTRANFTGKSLPQAVELYQNSGGGTAFDLAETGFKWIKYIRITGNGGEIDAISRVKPQVKTVTSPISP